jgi:hypothetical protein
MKDNVLSNDIDPSRTQWFAKIFAVLKKAISTKKAGR